MVEEGQVLVKMDTSEIEAELAKDKAKLAESEQAAAEVKTEITKDESQLKLADLEFKRSKSLYEKQSRRTGGVRPVQDPPGDGESLARRVQGQAEDGESVDQRGRGGSEANGGEDRRCHPQIAGQGASTLPACRAGRGRSARREDPDARSTWATSIWKCTSPRKRPPESRSGPTPASCSTPGPNTPRRRKSATSRPKPSSPRSKSKRRSERDKLMFRIKLQVPPELVLPYIERIKTGVRGMGYVRLDDTVAWPAFLERNFPPKP